MKRSALFGLIVGCVLGLIGCNTSKPPRDYKPAVARFFLEAGNGATGTQVTLPRSGVTLIMNAKPVLTEGDITDVELVQVELGKCLAFKLTASAARDFYRMSGSHQGRRLALTINGDAIGARRIDGAIADGVVFVFVETPDELLPQMVENLKKTSMAMQREIQRKG